MIEKIERNLFSLLGMTVLSFAIFTGCGDGGSKDLGIFNANMSVATPNILNGYYEAIENAEAASAALRFKVSDSKVSYAIQCRIGDDIAYDQGEVDITRTSEFSFRLNAAIDSEVPVGDKSCTISISKNASFQLEGSKLRAIIDGEVGFLDKIGDL